MIFGKDSSRGKKIIDRSVEHVGSIEIRNVSSVGKFCELRSGQRCLHLPHDRGHGAVLFTRQKQQRSCHGARGRTEIMVSESGRASDEAIDRCGQDHLPNLRQMRRICCDRLRRKPARDSRIDQPRHPLRLRNGDAPNTPSIA